MKITYTLVGDNYLPNLVAPESPKVGRWGMLRFNYLRKHREALYTIMLITITKAAAQSGRWGARKKRSGKIGLKMW